MAIQTKTTTKTTSGTQNFSLRTHRNAIFKSRVVQALFGAEGMETLKQQNANKQGFDFTEMYKIFSASGLARHLETSARENGAEGLAGYAQSGANTTPSTGAILIASDRNARTAALSYAFELTHATNRAELQEIFQIPKRNPGNDVADRKEYIDRVVAYEAKAAYNRAMVTLEFGEAARQAKETGEGSVGYELKTLYAEQLKDVKRKQYLDIASNDNLTKSEKLSRIELLIRQGNVGNGTAVLVYYGAQYDTERAKFKQPK